MLAYATARDQQKVRPTTLALIVGAHVAVVVLAMAAKMEVDRYTDPPTKLIELTTDVPTAEPPKPVPKSDPSNPVSQIDATDPIVSTEISTDFQTDILVERTPIGPIVWTEAVTPYVPPLEPPPIARTKAVLKTDAADLRPPYPDSKRLTDQEATLKLKLSIDDKGRVIAVQPVGEIDRAFLESARRHILRYWRYSPATEGSKAVHSSTTVTLQFELNG
ncbi:MAG: energy transducer TonB, partial [Sphingomicrobium sp.]